MNVKIKDFGKDHWSLLAYVECRCVDNRNEIDHRHLRINEARHAPIGSVLPRSTWKPEYGTRLKGYFVTTLCDTSIVNPARKIDWHDDWDCMEDLEAANLVNIISYVNGVVLLTDTGQAIANRIREHKAKGGVFATFELKGI